MRVKQLLDLSGRAAIVTGGSRGLGLQIAEALGEMGAKLALTARKKDELDHAVAHLAKQGVEAHAFACDIGKRDTIPALSTRCARSWAASTSWSTTRARCGARPRKTTRSKPGTSSST